MLEVLFWLYALVVFIIVLGVIILLHEGGHWYFAHKADILCHEYSIGMGPLVKQWKKPGQETAISIRAIPIGGYVSMAGEDTNESLLKADQPISINLETIAKNTLQLNSGDEISKDDSNEQIEVISEIITTDKIEGSVKGIVKEYDLYSENGNAMWIDLEVEGEIKRYYVKRDAYYVFSKKERVQVAPYDRCFESKKLGQRAITIFAGPMMNFVLALFIFMIVSFGTGVPNLDSTVIGELTPNFPAYEVLQEGDKITKVNGDNVSTWNEFSGKMDELNGDESVTLTVLRDGAEVTETIDTIVISYRIGISNAGYLDYDGDGIQVSLVFDDNYVVGKAGIKNGDIILGYYEGDTYKDCTDFKEIIEYVKNDENLSSIKLRVKNDESYRDITSTIWTKKSLDDLNLGNEIKTAIGVTCGYHFDFFGCLGNSFVLFWDSVTTVFKTLGALFANKQISINDLSGPVGIYQAVKSYLQTDFLTFLSFVGLISANIGVVNLLPIPALDGGRLVFIAYEAITRKKPSKKFETLLNNIVFWLVMALFVYITCKDIIRLF